MLPTTPPTIARTRALLLPCETFVTGMMESAGIVEVVSTTVVNCEPFMLVVTVVWRTVVSGALRVVLVLLFELMERRSQCLNLATKW